jgi:predicted permease
MTTVDTLARDVRYAARTIRRNPGFAAVAILTLALGIGTNAAVFSLIDGILLARLPYPSPHQLVSVKGTYPNGAFAAMRDEIRSMEAAAYAEGHSVTMKSGGEPTRATAARVSVEFFTVLGVKPQLGRWLRRGEDLAGRDRFVIVSDAVWESRFGRDAAIVGRSIEIDGVPREIIAVMPPTFRFPSARTELWVPLGIDPRQTAHFWAGDFMPVVGRLRGGATFAQAHAEVRTIQSRLPALFPWRMPDDWNRDVAVVPLREALVGSVRARLLILIAAVALVLVIACANVANLSLSRAVSREREIGIRVAIGARPGRIAGQLLTESIVVAALGAAAGLLVATQALEILKIVLPPETPRLSEVELNWRVLAFAGGLAALTGSVFGLAPVVHALRLRLTTALEAGGRGGARTIAGPLRAGLTIAQIGCAVLLVITAGLLVRGLWRLSQVDPGFRADHVVTARISPAQSICGSVERCLAFYETLEARLQAAPGVRSAGLVNTLPLTGAVAKRSLELEGQPVPASQTAPLFWLHAITPDYFRVMQMRLTAGRAFTRQDLSGSAVAIVSASTATRYWPDQPAVGKLVRFVGENHWHTIVGVVADVRAYDMTRSTPDWIAGTLYVPHGRRATLEDGRIPADMTLVLGTDLDGAQVAAMLRRIVNAIDGDVVIDRVKPMGAVLLDAVATPAATTTLLVSMAALALTLGCIGVYGVLSFLVSRRTRDFGIRLALGAQRSDLFWLVIKDGAALCAAGIAFGLAGAMVLTRWIASELHGVSAVDPATYMIVVALVSFVTLLACYVPTRRAMRVDPLVVLRDL